MVRRAPLYALYAADAISLAGNAVAQLAIPWFVLTTTGSATYTALAVFFNFLPIVLAGFLGGVIVDRLGFRTTSIAADLASSAAVAAIPLLHTTVGIELWQLFALVFVGALLDAPGATARAALLPDLAESAGMRLERASGIRSGIQQGAQLVGAPLGGVLIATVGATNALWLNAASFLVSAALVGLFVAAPTKGTEGEPGGRFFGELVDGLRFVWDQRLLRALVLTVLVTNLLDAPLPVVMAVFAEAEYGSAADLGVMYGVFGGAALVGSLAYGWRGHRLPRRRTFVVCFATIPVMYLVMATLPRLPVALLVLAVVGLAAGPLNPLIFTVTAEVVPTELRGRVFGAVRAGAWAAIPLGILVGGVLVETIGVAATFLAIGIAYAAVVGYGFFNPAFRDMDSASEPDDRDEVLLR
ncbi:MAG TPA: MFS transporter [Gaiellaceae bacterium]|nr:MFS transporter [Gaiellaceae bacterium]